MFLIVFSAFTIMKITHYETWMNNENWYYHPLGYNVECEFRLFGNPSPCIAIDENGNIVATKTGMLNWIDIVSINDTKGLIGYGKICEKNDGTVNLNPDLDACVIIDK